MYTHMGLEPEMLPLGFIVLNACSHDGGPTLVDCGTDL